MRSVSEGRQTSSVLHSLQARSANLRSLAIVAQHLQAIKNTRDRRQQVAVSFPTLVCDQDAATTWTDAGRDVLLTGGWPSIRRQIDDAREAAEESTQKEQLLRLRNYLAKHSTHLDFPTRLAEGRSISSGQVEGACKNLIGRRLKQTGARWTFRRVNRMGLLCCLVYSEHWKGYWNAT